MAVYSGAEIFQVAMQMEEAGRVFYETLANASEDQRIREPSRARRPSTTRRSVGWLTNSCSDLPLAVLLGMK
jgi:hypothetical protein